VRITWPARYDWPGATGIVETLLDGLKALVSVRIAPTPQPWEGVVLLDVAVGGRSHRVGIDYADSSDENRDCVPQTELYFKLQYRRSGYDASNIFPGGFPVGAIDFYKYLPALREHSDAHKRIGVYGRFGLRFQADLRAKAMGLLAGTPDLAFRGQDGKVRYSRFLREASQAKISIDLPGYGAFCHRLVEFLGLGTCVAAVRHANSLHVPLTEGMHYVAVKDDLSDLVDVCRYYLSREAERAEIARSGRDFFDRYLHCDQLAAYYLRTMMDRLA
jgi:hypothetical protein